MPYIGLIIDSSDNVELATSDSTLITADSTIITADNDTTI